MPNFTTPVRRILLTIFAVTILVYAGFKAQNLIQGPVLSITSPQNGETLRNPLVLIEGEAHNIAFISLNDRQIFIDSAGHFKEELLLPPGYSIISLKARDKFNRDISRRLELVYQPN